MKDVYSIAGITRQAHFKDLQKQANEQKGRKSILTLCQALREEHPRMGCRAMYDLLKEEITIGRDRFEALVLSNGYRVGKLKNYTRTTYSVKDNYHPNLITSCSIGCAGLCY